MPPERNLLIEAGAGTGKTTRLVKAVLQGLFIRQIPLEEMVALTFTNKAAGELKDRVGRALEDVLEAGSIDALRQKPWWPLPEPTLPLSDLQTLARLATGVLDRANISTIHSFAYSLLKRFPLAAGIDPDSQIDDKGLRFDELFRREWAAWLTVELGDKAPRETPWLELLSKLSLSEIERATRRLADFQTPLDKLVLSDENLTERLKKFHGRIQDLARSHPGDRKADAIARACEEVLGAAAHGEWEKLEKLSGETIEELEKDPGSETKEWNREDLDRLEILQAVAKNLRARGDRVISLLTELVRPFVRAFRQTLLSEGCLTHSALLYLSREIVKNQPDVRAALKRKIRLILIDEFQDTDPLQAELLLYLAEKPGLHAAEWDQVQIEAGKLFIVGDPKQSIYRFRGADIAAYERIGKLLVEQGGSRETLEVNYRSQAQIIHIVNAAFERIIQPIPEISPPYVAVLPHHPHDPSRLVQDVQIWIADSAEKQTVEDAQATEAEHIARWIKDSQNVLTIHDPREGPRTLAYRDVALIFRTYSPMDRYIEALRRHGIPFAVESERYFFTTPEVTDFINLLRAADNPEDLLSLVGFLRGSLGGLSDDEILRRKNAGTLEELESVRWLRTITRRLGRQPLTEVLRHIFEDTYLLELASRSYHGDQTVANLLKLRRLIEGFASAGVTTTGLLLERLAEFFADDTIEGESPLADENYNAVRLLTIHKAKGLEYPVVFLPSLHSELRAHPADSFVFDWRSQKLGLSVKDNSNATLSNLDKLELDEQTRRREAAEENRILYVAMTRARERLVLSGGLNLKTARARTYFQRLVEAWGHSLGTLNEGKLELGGSQLTVRRLPRVDIREESPRSNAENPLQNVDPAYFAKIWKTRAEQCRQAMATLLVATPSGDVPNLLTSQYPAVLGTLVHRFLEQWDFTCEKCSMPAQLRRVANSYFQELGRLREPFPDPRNTTPFYAASDPMAELLAIVEEAQDILADFIDSDAYNEIKSAKILGREVPFFYAMKDNSLMRGTLDILYELPDGSRVVGDYKTDKEPRPEKYAAQAQAYREAVQRAFGKEAAFKLIYLRDA